MEISEYRSVVADLLVAGVSDEEFWERSGDAFEKVCVARIKANRETLPQDPDFLRAVELGRPIMKHREGKERA